MVCFLDLGINRFINGLVCDFLNLQLCILQSDVTVRRRRLIHSTSSPAKRAFAWTHATGHLARVIVYFDLHAFSGTAWPQRAVAFVGALSTGSPARPLSLVPFDRWSLLKSNDSLLESSWTRGSIPTIEVESNASRLHLLIVLYSEWSVVVAEELVERRLERQLNSHSANVVGQPTLDLFVNQVLLELIKDSVDDIVSDHCAVGS